MIDKGKHAPLLGYIKGRPTTRKKQLDATIYTYKTKEVIINLAKEHVQVYVQTT